MCFHGLPSLDCCIIQIYMPNRTGLYTKYGILLLILSLTMIHNTIGLDLPMFINATTNLQAANFNIFNRPLLIFACLFPPHLEKWGTKKFFRSHCSRILFCTPTLKSACRPCVSSGTLNCTQTPVSVLCRLLCRDAHMAGVVVTVLRSAADSYVVVHITSQSVHV